MPFRPVRRRVPDVVLQSHRRETLRWRADIVGGSRRAIVGVTFLGCQSQCPPSDVLFSQLDMRAPPHIDLYTLTLSPLTDDWRLLARRADDFKASPRWRWLTGEPRDVYAVLDSLDIDFSNLDRHGQMVLRAGGGQAERLDALPDADSLLRSFS